MYDFDTFKGFTEEEGKERAEKIFETLDKNGDGSLEEEEFIKVLIEFPSCKRTNRVMTRLAGSYRALKLIVISF